MTSMVNSFAIFGMSHCFVKTFALASTYFTHEKYCNSLLNKIFVFEKKKNNVPKISKKQNKRLVLDEHREYSLLLAAFGSLW